MSFSCSRRVQPTAYSPTAAVPPAYSDEFIADQDCRGNFPRAGRELESELRTAPLGCGTKLVDAGWRAGWAIGMRTCVARLDGARALTPFALTTYTLLAYIASSRRLIPSP